MAIALEDLVSDVRILSGLKANQYFTDVNIAMMLSDLWAELHDRFVTANQHYDIQEFDFTLTGGVDGNSVALPDNFQLGNGLELNPDDPRPQSVDYLSNWLNRNNLGLNVLTATIPAVADRRYCFKGSDLVIYPPGSSAGDYRLYYTPMPEQLLAEESYTPPELDPADGYFGMTNDWTFDNAVFTVEMVGWTLTIANDPLGVGYNGSYVISEVLSATSLRTTTAPAGTFSLSGLATAVLTYQAPGTTNELPNIATPWAVYLKIGASLAIREAQERDCADLQRRFDQQQVRVDKALINRQEEPTQPPLTRDANYWDNM